MFRKYIEMEEGKVRIIEGELKQKIKKLLRLGKLKEEDWKEEKEEDKDELD